MEVKEEELKKMYRCSCKNCFNEKEYNKIISLQQEFQKNNKSKMKKVEIEREALMSQIQVPSK